MDSILRTEETKAFKTLTFEGKVLDLGGVKNSGYLRLVHGNFDITSVNFDINTGCDVIHDLEVTPIPFDNVSFDVVVINNTLEHIYHAQELVKESVRVLKKKGKVVITVPFLFPEHPSPHDYWRFTGDSMRLMLRDAGLSEVFITPLGTGVFTVCHHFIERLLPRPLRIVLFILRPLTFTLDAIVYSLRKKSSVQNRKQYALGYFVVGTK
jgi:SAM-dependent methyltransferase